MATEYTRRFFTLTWSEVNRLLKKVKSRKLGMHNVSWDVVELESKSGLREYSSHGWNSRRMMKERSYYDVTLKYTLVR